MAYKFIVICACIAVANAGLLPVAEPNYNFNYEVQDELTGDFKSQSESRNGDVVRGQYSLHDADGYQRTVEYSVEGESGFRASVRREPLGEAARKFIPAQAAVVEADVKPVLKAAPSKPLEVPKSLPVLQKPLKLETQTAYVQPATYIRTAYAAPAVLHHAPAHTVIHSAPAVHLAPATHFVHAAPATTTLLKASPGVITHHGPAVVRTVFDAHHIY